MDEVILQGAVAEISAFSHPGLRKIKIVYCDDQPNSNKQGVEYEDFEDIKKSIIGTPLKINFLPDKKKGEAGTETGHEGSIPIGFINSVSEELESGVHKLIVDGILFAEEYPVEVKYLQDSFDKGTAPSVSFEMGYKTSIIKDGVEWLKGVVAKAATFVKFPAYGKRTAVLAFASDNNMEAEDIYNTLKASFEEHSPKNTPKGGSNTVDEKEFNDMKQKVADLEKAAAEHVTEMAAKVTEIQTLTQTVADKDTALAEKDTKLAEYTDKETIAKRQAELAAAEITIEIKPERLLKMDDEAFAEYLADLKATAEASKKLKTTVASHRGTSIEIPRFETTSDVPVEGLAGRLRDLSRNRNAAVTE